MTRKGNDSDEQRSLAGNPSPANPEEGHRLLSAFLNIRHAGLRKAIINFVTKMSKLHGDLR